MSLGSNASYRVALPCPSTASAYVACSFGSLPVELKKSVFEWAYRIGGGGDYTSILRVNRSWNKLAAPLLWTFIVLNNDNILPFVRSMTECRNETGRLTHNLSIAINPVRRINKQFPQPLTQLGFDSDVPWTPADISSLRFPVYLKLHRQMLQTWKLEDRSLGTICLVAALHELASLIHTKMRKLITISLRAGSAPTNPYIPVEQANYPGYTVDTKDFLPLDVIASLLNALPLSCTQIELAVPETGQTRLMDSGYGTNVLCDALTRLLPFITHLRLHCHHISPFIFGVLTELSLPNLQSLALATGGMDLEDYRCRAYSELDTKFAINDETIPKPWGLMNNINQLRLQNIVVKMLKSSLNRGRYPSIQFLELQNMQASPDFALDHVELYVKKINIMENRIQIVPYIYLCLGDDNQEADDESLDFEAWIRASKISGRLQVVDSNQFEDCSVNSWISSSTGTRVPADMQHSRALQKYAFEWIESSSIGTSSDRFVERIRSEMGESVARTTEKGLQDLVGSVRKPYFIEGLLEWYY